MSEWTPKVVADEWERRAAGKYGAELRGESVALMADVMFGSPPRFDIIEWARTVRYKPTATVNAHYDATNMVYVLAVSIAVQDVRDPSKTTLIHRSEHLPGYTFDRLTHVEGAKVATRILRNAIIDLEHHEIDEWLTVGGEHVREPTHG